MNAATLLPGAKNEQLSNTLTVVKSLLTDKELAKYLKVSLPTIHRWRAAGEGPTPRKLGKKLVRYRVEDADAWLDGLAMTGTTAKTNGQ
jgi:excisionase family DNA binding protein